MEHAENIRQAGYALGLAKRPPIERIAEGFRNMVAKSKQQVRDAVKKAIEEQATGARVLRVGGDPAKGIITADVLVPAPPVVELTFTIAPPKEG